MFFCILYKHAVDAQQSKTWISWHRLHMLPTQSVLICWDKLSVQSVGMWINDFCLYKQASAPKTINLPLLLSPSQEIPSHSCHRFPFPSSSSLHPPDPPHLPTPPRHWRPRAHTHQDIQGLARTDPRSDPHPSRSLSLLYLCISTSIGYTCNLATVQREDPPIPSRCFDCRIWQPIKLCQISSKSQSRFGYHWELPCVLHLFDPKSGQRNKYTAGLCTHSHTHTHTHSPFRPTRRDYRTQMSLGS